MRYLGCHDMWTDEGTHTHTLQNGHGEKTHAGKQISDATCTAQNVCQGEQDMHDHKSGVIRYSYRICVHSSGHILLHILFHKRGMRAIA